MECVTIVLRYTPSNRELKSENNSRPSSTTVKHCQLPTGGGANYTIVVTPTGPSKYLSGRCGLWGDKFNIEFRGFSS